MTTPPPPEPPVPKLQNGDRMPRIQAPALDEEEPMVLPEELEGEPAVVIFYRGHW